MKQIQRGFTLIELVMVIVILGVLAAVAIPKFVDLKGDAQLAAMKATAGAAAAASTINYAGCAANSNAPLAGKCVKILNCSGVPALLSGGAWPTGYASTDVTPAATANGDTLACTLTLTGYTPAAPVTFDVIGAGI
jgi:MSHA pilin protein MshA